MLCNDGSWAAPGGPVTDQGPRSLRTPVIDSTVAHAARVYDYLLGGTENFAVDRDVAEANAAAFGGLDVSRAEVRAIRSFLGRAVRFLVTDAGVRQFLDIGTGLPNADNVHGVAQRAAPDCRVVYVDNDPLVLAHAHRLLASTAEGATTFVIGDFWDPESILLRAEATLDLGEPVALVLSAILHLFPDDHDPHRVVTRLVDAVPSGSYLVISHMAADLKADAMANLAREADRNKAAMNFTFAMRTREEICRFLIGLDPVEPGLVPIDQWKPEDCNSAPTAVYGVVARKP
jgi:hypothetical protein